MRIPGTVLALLLIVASVSIGEGVESPPITSLRFAPDGKSVVVGSQSGVEIYHWPRLMRLQSWKTSVENIHEFKFSDDGSRLAICGGVPSEEGIVELVSWPKGDLLKKFSLQNDCIASVEWVGDELLLSTSLDHSIHLLNWNTGRRSVNFKAIRVA